MGILDDSLRTVASVIIGTFADQYATIVRLSDSVYDPRSGQRSSPVISSYPIKISVPEKYKHNEIDGTSILQTDFKTYMAAADLAIVPVARVDTLAFNNKTYSIYNVTPHYSGDLVCLWEIQLRA